MPIASSVASNKPGLGALCAGGGGVLSDAGGGGSLTLSPFLKRYWKAVRHRHQLYTQSSSTQVSNSSPGGPLCLLVIEFDTPDLAEQNIT